MQDFDGIAAKLVRAEENINNLQIEMGRFFDECDYPTLPQDDRETLLKAIQYHKNLVIPLRFSVLAGEVIHHLRSCFDHVAWHFSVGPVDDPRRIEFPVFEKTLNSDRRKRFEGKIEGIVEPKVRALIERIQPCNSSDPLDDPLWIIHDFDILDKHREPLLCVGTGSTILPRAMKEVFEDYRRAHPELNPAQVARHFKNDGPTVPCISFRNFGRREVHSVSEGLIDLFNYTVSVIAEFKNI